MVQTTPSTISLTAPKRTKEFFASEILSPGHIMELLSTGKVQKNDKVGLPITRLIALEKEYDGKGISSAYAADDTVVMGVFEPGDEVVLRLPASAAAVVVGDYLEPFTGGVVRLMAGSLTNSTTGTADGTVADATSSFSQTITNNNNAEFVTAINKMGPFAMALEAVDNSGNGASEAFIRAILL